MLLTRWLSWVVKDVRASFVICGADKLCALDGTLSRSMPKPGSGLVAMTWTVGKAIEDASAAPPGTSAAGAAGPLGAAVGAGVGGLGGAGWGWGGGADYH